MMIQNQVRSFSPISAKQMFSFEGKKEKREKGHPFKWNRVCPYCGSEEMIPAGSCHICTNCGAGTGCS